MGGAGEFLEVGGTGYTASMSGGYHKGRKGIDRIIDGIDRDFRMA